MSGFLFGGGGGGGFFLPSIPAADPTAFICDCAPPAPPVAAPSPPVPFPMYPPTFPDTPYFWSKPLAVLTPAATCSPCLCRKLFAVLAALLASDRDTELGFFLKSDMVFKAACFCAHVMP